LKHEHSYEVLIFGLIERLGTSMIKLKKKFSTLYKNLFTPTESINVDSLVLILQGYYAVFHDQLRSDRPEERLDSFFDLVSAAVSPATTVTPDLEGQCELATPALQADVAAAGPESAANSSSLSAAAMSLSPPQVPS
jgi:hypothetical protein